MGKLVAPFCEYSGALAPSARLDLLGQVLVVFSGRIPRGREVLTGQVAARVLTFLPLSGVSLNRM